MQTPSPVPGCIWVPLRNRDREVVAYTLIDEQESALVGLSWSLKRPSGYAVRWGPDTDKVPILMHREIMAAPPGVEVDHINRDRLDNRRCNLRFATRGGNCRNRGKGATSAYKGVHRSGLGWGATVVWEGIPFYLGVSESPEEAAITYDLAAMALHGEFAATNFRYERAALLMLDELRKELLWSIGKRLRSWAGRFGRLRDKRLRLEVSGAI